MSAVLALCLLGAPAAAGVAVEGRDRARILVPSGARVDAYANAGYRLTVGGGEAVVEVELAPLVSGVRFEPPRRRPADAVARVARAQTSGAATRLEAVSRILAWVSRHIEYRLDRREPQDAAAVLERRTAYCTGVARLTVALLGSVGIEAREVAGYVADRGPAGRGPAGRGPADRGPGRGEPGYHRWVEVYFPDLGWVFSDPLTSHHFVPATYVRLASEELDVVSGLDGLLLERLDGIADVDVHPGSAPGVRARRNTERRLAASLRVRVDGAGETGEVELVGASTLYRRGLAGGETTFVGLEPGRYELVLSLPGHDVLRQEVELPDRGAESLTIGLGTPPAGPAALGRAAEPRR